MRTPMELADSARNLAESNKHLRQIKFLKNLFCHYEILNRETLIL